MKNFLRAALFSALFLPGLAGFTERAQAQTGCLAYSNSAKTITTTPYRLSGTDNCHILVVNAANAVITIPPPGTNGELTEGYHVRVFNATSGSITLGGTVNGTANPTIGRGFASDLVVGNSLWYATYTSTTPVPIGGSPSAGALNDIQLSDGSGGFLALTPGTGVATALAINVGSAAAFTKNNGDALSGTYTGAPTFSGNLTFSGVPKFTGLSAGTQTSCLGLDVSNNIVTGSCIGVTGANPSAIAGPTAFNGVATTFMRSDAAPAIQLGSSSQKGIVQVDNTTITASGGVISAVGGGSGITALTGDVTASGPGSAAATIASSAVTNAKMANMASLTFKGNVTGGTAAPSDLSVLSMRSNIGIDARRTPAVPAGSNTLLATDGVVTLGGTSWGVDATWTLPLLSSVNDGKIIRVADNQGVLNGHALSIAAGGSDTLVGTSAINAAWGNVFLVADTVAGKWTGWGGIPNSTTTGQLCVGQGSTTPCGWVTLSGDVTSVSNVGAVVLSKVNGVTYPNFGIINTVPFYSANQTLGATSALSGAILSTDASNVPSLSRTPTLGKAGTAVGTLSLENATSGTLTITPPTGALGTPTQTLQAATDTFVYRATTDTLTNKTINCVSGNTCTLPGTIVGSSGAHSAGNTRYIPLTGLAAGTANIGTIPPRAGTVHSISATSNVDLGSGKNVSATLTKGGSDTGLTCTLTGNGTGPQNTCTATTDVAVTTSDLLGIKIVADAATTAATIYALVEIR